MAKGLHRAQRRRVRSCESTLLRAGGPGRVAGRVGIIAGVVALATTTVGLPLAAAPQQATQSLTQGAAADCVAVVAGARKVRIVCGVTDLDRDGDAVYIGWRTTSGGVRSVYDRAGAGRTISVTADAPTAVASPPHRVLWKVCRDRQAPWTDNCSEWHGAWATVS